MNEGQLTRALAAGNAWWRDPAWERKDRDLRALSATTLDYDPSPLSDVVPDGLYVLRGPRRVGKSLEVKRAIARLIHGGVEPRSIIHFACDELGRGDLQRLVNAGREVLTRGLEGERYWFLDEITSVPAWPEAIKWLRDNTAFGDDCVVDWMPRLPAGEVEPVQEDAAAEAIAAHRRTPETAEFLRMLGEDG